MNFRVALVHKALMAASKVCHKGYRIILDSEPGQSGVLHKHTGERIDLREENGVYVFDGWISPAATAGRKRTEGLSIAPYERDADMALTVFTDSRAIRKNGGPRANRRATHESKGHGGRTSGDRRWKGGSQSCSMRPISPTQPTRW